MARPALSATRAVDIVELLARHPNRRFTLTEIGHDTGVNAASLHAVLAVLERRGYVERHPTHRTYGLGSALAAAGSVALGQHPALADAADALDDLSDRLGLEIVLTAPAGIDIIVVGRSHRHSAFGDAMRVGQRLPLSPPLGTVFLAWAPESEIVAWLGRAHPPLDPADTEQQRRQLQLVRERGYAVALESEARRSFASAVADPSTPLTARPTDATVDDLLADLAHSRYHLDSVDDDRTYDVILIAAPIFDAHGFVSAAVSATGFGPAQTAADVHRVADELVGATTIITRRTSGRVPEPTRGTP